MQPKRSREIQVRFFVDGERTDGAGFVAAVRRLGRGEGGITYALQHRRWVLTEKGRAAAEAGREGRP